jgi:hypothetical protein
MSVYFDPRVKTEAEAVADADEVLTKIQEHEKQQLGQKIVSGIARLFISPVVLMLFWNWIMPGLFGLATIGYLKAFGLVVISSILFPRND